MSRPGLTRARLQDPGVFAERVIRWQAEQGRHDLPWQGTRDPYRVWLSEIMLQQTQVATVQAYYARFLQRFADVQALAAAPLDEVLGLWSGLGYYSRARNLHRCAQQVVVQWGGRFPSTAAELQTLPGIGPSTAAAIAAFCFGERSAILDGNVRRVLARVFGVDEDLRPAAAQRRLWQLASRLLPQERLSHSMPAYTQGLMDLGATVCRPRRPLCGQCPLADACVAAAEGAPERYPVRAPAPVRQDLQLWLLHALDPQGQVWLAPRPASGIWARLHCLPAFDSRQQLEQQLPLGCDGLEHPVFRHALTHRELHIRVLTARLPASVRLDEAGRWFGPGDWQGLGLPAPVRRFLQAQEEAAAGAS